MRTSRTHNLQVVTTPTFDWLAQKARECRSRVLIASPYVNNGFIQLTDLVPRDVSRTLVTRTDMRDFALGASNLETLCTLARDGVTVRSLSDLHAKIYIFDDTSALVTSANATYSGMYSNWECGLGTSDSKLDFVQSTWPAHSGRKASLNRYRYFSVGQVLDMTCNKSEWLNRGNLRQCVVIPALCTKSS